MYFIKYLYSNYYVSTVCLTHFSSRKCFLSLSIEQSKAEQPLPDIDSRFSWPMYSAHSLYESQYSHTPESVALSKNSSNDTSCTSLYLFIFIVNKC